MGTGIQDMSRPLSSASLAHLAPDAAACMSRVLSAIQADADDELAIALKKLREVCSSQDEFEEMLCQPQYLERDNYLRMSVLAHTINWRRPACLRAVLDA